MPTSEPISVALFTDTYAPQLNGVARTLGRLEARALERGMSLRIYTPRDRRPASDRIIEAPSVSCPAYPELRLAPPMWPAAARSFIRQRPSVVHAATPFGTGLAGRRLAQTFGVPLITSYHTSFSAYAGFYGLGALAGPAWRYLRWFHNAGLATLAPTYAVASELVAHGFRGVGVWSRGVDCERFSPERRTRAMRVRLDAPGAADIVVGYVGRIAKEKGIGMLLEAVRTLQGQPGAPRVRLALAGDGPFLVEARRLAPPGTILTGRLDGDALASFYASLDIFVFPSVTDTFGNVLLEAMASGVAVVAADSGPSREVLAGGRGVIARAQTGALADAIARLARRPDERRALATLGRAHTETIGWPEVLDELLDTYERVARRHAQLPAHPAADPVPSFRPSAAPIAS